MLKITRKSCSNCRQFKPRDPNGPWPIGGVSKQSTGTCGRKKISKETEWRSDTDWCNEHQRKERPL